MVFELVQLRIKDASSIVVVVIISIVIIDRFITDRCWKEHKRRKHVV